MQVSMQVSVLTMSKLVKNVPLITRGKMSPCCWLFLLLFLRLGLGMEGGRSIAEADRNPQSQSRPAPASPGHPATTLVATDDPARALQELQRPSPPPVLPPPFAAVLRASGSAASVPASTVAQSHHATS